MFTRIHVHRVLAAAVVVTMMGGVLGYGVYSLSDDVAAIVAQLPEAAQRLRRTMQRDGSPGPIDQVKKAAEELQKTADQAAGGQNAVPDNVRRVQIEEPAINVKQYLVGLDQPDRICGPGDPRLLFVFFLLASGDLFKRKLVKLAGPSLERRRSPFRSSTTSTIRSPSSSSSVSSPASSSE